MCDFAHRTWTCQGDGFLWDAEADHIDFDGKPIEYPCPQCNTHQYLLDAKTDAESCSEGAYDNHSFTGESLWLACIEYAQMINPTETAKSLLEIGAVRTLRPATNRLDTEVVVYTYFKNQ